MFRTSKNIISKRILTTGFTMAEALVALSISLIIIFAVTQSLSRGRDFWQIASAKSNLHLSGQRAMDYMLAELKNATRAAGASPPNINIPASRTSIKFYLPTDIDGNGLIIDATGNTEWAVGGPIQYQYVPGQNQLRRLEDGNQRVLANNVSGVSFDDASTDTSLYLDEVHISLNLQKTTVQQRDISASFVSIVKLRN